jgi:hypothetical protein
MSQRKEVVISYISGEHRAYRSFEAITIDTTDTVCYRIVCTNPSREIYANKHEVKYIDINIV